MITGFNTDIDHEGRVFHVQTEDKGLDNPVVESLIYCGGEIIAKKDGPYADLLEREEYSEEEVLRRMESQHQAHDPGDPQRPLRQGSAQAVRTQHHHATAVSTRSCSISCTASVRLDAIRLELIDEQTPGGRDTADLDG